MKHAVLDAKCSRTYDVFSAGCQINLTGLERSISGFSNEQTETFTKMLLLIQVLSRMSFNVSPHLSMGPLAALIFAVGVGGLALVAVEVMKSSSSS